MEQAAPLQVTFENLSYSVKVRATDKAGSDAVGGGGLGRVRAAFTKTRYEDKTILHGLTGTFRPGRLTAILGPSGSGKTTLLNLLAGHETAGTTSGDMWVNGRSATGASLRLLAGYVSQDDVILSTQTVREAIEMSVILRPPPLSSESQTADDSNDHLASADTANGPGGGLRAAGEEGLPLPAAMAGPMSTEADPKQRPAAPPRGKVTHVEQKSAHAISLLGLERCQDTRVGDSSDKGISGGERKRTAIAQEWVTQAPIMFLDEPTSGLDAHSALMVTKQLKAIANRGRTVVAVLHQPSSEMFELIDDLLVLLEGRVVYLGERAGLVDYVAALGFPCGMYTNPADHVFNAVLFAHGGGSSTPGSRTTAAERAEQLLEAWRRSESAARLQALVDGPELAPVHASQFRRISPPLTQLQYLTRRAALNAKRNPLVINLRLGQAVFFGLLIGFIFLNTENRPANVQQQNFSGALFFSATSNFLLAVLSVVNAFSQERLVFMRESQGGYYGLPAYFLSKNIIEVPIQIIMPIIYASISYWLLGLRHDGVKFLLFTATTIALNLCGFSFGLFLASTFRDVSAVLAALPVMFLPFFLFGGLLVNTGNSTVWLRWLQWISPIKYGYTAMMKNQFTGYVVDGTPIGDAYLDAIDLGPFSIGVNIVFVLVLALATWVAAYLSLMRLVSEKSGKQSKRNTRKLRQALEGPLDARFTQTEKEKAAEEA